MNDDASDSPRDPPGRPPARPGLRTRVARGGVGLIVGRVAEQSLRLIRLIVLARILVPDDFGLMGIALLTMATLQTFSEPGFQVALIRKKENVGDYLNTAWTVGLIRGMVLFLLLALLAPAVGRFFDAPAAARVIQIVGLSVLLQALTNIGTVFFHKELEFNKQFLYQIGGTLADFVVAVSAALIWRNVWALLAGLLVGDLVRVVASYAIHPYRPRLELNWGRARELWGFGRWILGSSVLVFLSTQGDDIVVGKMLGATMLAFYQLAYRISNLPATEFSRLLSTLMLPAFARLQNDRVQLRRGYDKVLQLSALIACPVAGLIYLFAGDFTRLFLGEKWLPMVAAMQVLAVTGLFRSIAAPGPLFLAIDKPWLRTRLQLFGLVVLAVLIVPFTLAWGIVGTAWAATARVALSKTVAVLLAMRETGGSYAGTARLLLLPAVNTAVCVGLLRVVETRWLAADGVWQLVLLIGVGLGAYLLISRLCDLMFHMGSGRLLREQLSALRGRS